MQIEKFVFSFILLLCVPFPRFTNADFHTNQFAVKIPGPIEVADSVAKKYGFLNRGQIGSLEGYYLFESKNVEKRSTERNVFHSTLLQKDTMVQWSEQQIIKSRVKRSNVEDNSTFIDPLYPEQWFLHGGGYGGYDMNVLPAWKRGYTGKNIVVSILDDGIQGNHPDLASNYDKDASWDINDSDADPSPQDDDDNKHGTRCAGEVAAIANNEFCGVGVAYNAKIGGVRMLDGSVTDSIEAAALSLQPNHIQIYSASWGPEDDGKTVDAPGHLAKKAFQNGIKKGRNGLGSIFVWASGNGGKHGDNCNCDGYTNSIYTISVSSATQSGTKPWYLEECSSTLATTYSSGAANRDKNIITVDVNYQYLEELKHGKPNTSNLCTKSHTGTSASAPIAAGLCALALEANPTLTWRDMQYIIVLTSRYTPLKKEDGWITNGIGRKVSTKFGYGLMDAESMVKIAEEWKTVPPQHICSTLPDLNERLIPSGRKEKVEANMVTNGCENTDHIVRYIEHVQVRITLTFHPRGNLRIVLISPSGTPSPLLLPRVHDRKEGTFKDWPFMSVQFWGEQVNGVWKLIIINDGNLVANAPGKLKNWSITFYGTDSLPALLMQHERNEQDRQSEHAHPVRGLSDLSEISVEDCKLNGKFFATSETGQNYCTYECPSNLYGSLKDSTCHRCDKSCSVCYGPSYNNCLSCPAKYLLLNSTCVKSCPEGYFASFRSHSHMCIPCVPSCVTCKGNVNECTLCKNGFFLYDTQCLSYCPDGTYAEKNKCLKCSDACESCFGPSETECLQCSDNFYLMDSTCLTECPLDHFVDNRNRCVKCHSSCSSCNTELTCLSCKEGFSMEPANSLCTYFLCESNEQDNCMSSCDYGSCRFCPTGPNHCELCTEGVLFRGSCHKSCPLSTYMVADECKICYGKCYECQQSPYQCMSCIDRHYLFEDMCLASCPPGFFAASDGICKKCHSFCEDCFGASASHCVSCTSDLYLLNHRCIDSCPSGYYASVLENIKECLPCHPSCKECSAYGPLFCISCYPEVTQVDTACIPCIDGEFYNDKEKTCQKCHDNCGACYGALEDQCLSCVAPLRLHEHQHSCLPCCHSSEKNPNCCMCTIDLDVCVTHRQSQNMNVSINFPSDDILFPTHIVLIAVAISATVILIFVILFGILQYRSSGWCHFRFAGKQYMRVPRDVNSKFNTEQEKVALTEADFEEEDDIFQKI